MNKIEISKFLVDRTQEEAMSSPLSLLLPNFDKNIRDFHLKKQISSPVKPNIDNKITETLLKTQENLSADSSSKKRYKCRFCKAKFQRYGCYIKHISKKHTDNKDGITTELRCKVCQCVFSSNRRFGQHKRRCSIETQCQICMRIFSSRRKFGQHKRRCSPEKPYKSKDVNVDSQNCSICQENVMYNHFKEHHQEFLCNISQDVTTGTFNTNNVSMQVAGDIENLSPSNKSTSLDHSQQYNTYNECIYCGVQFSTTKQLENHVLSMHKTFKRESILSSQENKGFIYINVCSNENSLDSKECSFYNNTSIGKDIVVERSNTTVVKEKEKSPLVNYFQTSWSPTVCDDVETRENDEGVIMKRVYSSDNTL